MAKLKKANPPMRSRSNKTPQFSKGTLSFIIKASRQKNVTWLDKNREEYEKLLVKPLQHLASFVAKKLENEASGYHFPLKGIGRIKRAANRVDEDRGVFKDWISYSASRPAKSRFEHNPNLYFSIQPFDEDGDYVLVAGGLYMPSSPQLRAIREAIAHDATPFEKLFASKPFASCFKGGFSKDRISSRNPRGFDPNHPKMEWLKLQAFFVWKPHPMKVFTSPKFPEQLAADWKQILRLNALLDDAIRRSGSKPIPKVKTPGLVNGVEHVEVIEQRKYDF